MNVKTTAGATRQRAWRRRSRRSGAMLVLVTLMLAGFLVALAFSVDVAQMHLTRTELRTSTDAAAQAAAAALSDSQDVDFAIARGRAIAAQNVVGGDPLLLAAEDFELGRSVRDGSGVFRFTAGETPTNSVRVVGRRTADSLSNVIPPFFGHVLGRRTFAPRLAATATYVERDVVLVIDRSGSMRGLLWNDLEQAIATFIETLDQTPVDEHLGLASYSDGATEDLPLTSNLWLIDDAMAGLEPNGMTSISRGIEAGESIFESGRSSRFVERTMIVMTDGLHNTGEEPTVVASQVAETGIVLHTITFGGNADMERMREVAAIGGGRHFHADDGFELRDVYREVALTLSTMMTE